MESQYKVRDIHSHARAIGANFQTVGCAPMTWGRADAEIAHMFRREMHSKFFEFTLCNNDWKADLLATEHYPSWYNNHIRADNIKAEVKIILPHRLGLNNPCPLNQQWQAIPKE